jgi:hypothetical protein
MVSSVYGTQAILNSAPVANHTYRPRQGLFYALDQDLLTPPKPAREDRVRLLDWLAHPLQSWQFSRKLGINASRQETFGTRIAMYKALRKNLSRRGRSHLYQQLVQGRLTDTRTDDKRSTLSHLYSIMTTPRAQGINSKLILEETLRLMSEPQTITQKFGTLKQQSLQQMMNFYNSGYGPQLAQPVDMNTLRVTTSATCVASSVMYYMANRNPGEFARHISELTSPRQAFFEKAWLNEISPEDPSQAAQKLNDYGIPAAAVPGTNGALYWVKVELPYSGMVRALNQQDRRDKGSRSVVEAVYQAALTHLVVRSYDPGLDMRVNPDGTLDPAKGLEEDRKTLMESIIKDNGGVMSVTYQFTAASRDNQPYLMGYYRNFEQTTRDLMQAIDMGEDVIIGITDTDTTGSTAGRINMGHEITVTGYERDKKTGEIYFIVADSDDDKPKLVKRAASEVVPKIHHAGFPVKLAQKIWGEINGRLDNQYLVPGPEDGTKYKLVATVPPSRQPAFLEEYQRMIMEEEARQQQATGQPSQAQYQVQQPQPQPLPIQPQPRQYQSQPNMAYATYPGSYYANYGQYYQQVPTPPAAYYPGSYYSNYGNYNNYNAYTAR